MKELESITNFTQGDIEVSFSTNIGVGFATTNSIMTSNYSSGFLIQENSSRPFIFLISASMGVCIIDGLSVEPEFDINFITDSEISTTLLLNVTYHFALPRKRTFPFIKLGYGLSNFLSGSDYGYYYQSNNSSIDTQVINVGVGVKVIYTSGTAMRIELNYKHFSSSNSSSYSDQYYNQSTYSDTDIDALTFSIGFSILI